MATAMVQDAEGGGGNDDGDADEKVKRHRNGGNTTYRVGGDSGDGSGDRAVGSSSKSRKGVFDRQWGKKNKSPKSSKSNSSNSTSQSSNAIGSTSQSSNASGGGSKNSSSKSGPSSGLAAHDELRRFQVSQPLRAVKPKWPAMMTAGDKAIFKANGPAMRLLIHFGYANGTDW